MSWPPMTRRRLEFDVILDEWPGGVQSDALRSLIASGDVTAVRLPYGFVGLKMIHTQTLLYVEAGRPHIKQVLPMPGSKILKYRGTGTLPTHLEYPRL